MVVTPPDTFARSSCVFCSAPHLSLTHLAWKLGGVGRPVPPCLDQEGLGPAPDALRSHVTLMREAPAPHVAVQWYLDRPLRAAHVLQTLSLFPGIREMGIG